MNFRFTFKGIPPKTHCYKYNGLSCWYNMDQVVWMDFKDSEFDFNSEMEDDDMMINILVHHLNVAIMHGLIDQQMFFGECKKEGWDPLYMWNIKLVLAMGMGDWDDLEFKEMFDYVPYYEPQSIMAEHDLRTGELKIPYHYHKKRPK